jgi:acyl dehydratase
VAQTDTPSTALKQRWFEDYSAGEVFEFGEHAVTEAEIVGFARQYDPQFFHVDAQAAQHSPYGGLIGSGWMSTAIAMRMMCAHFLPRDSVLGSPGVDQLRWLQPVRPGDTLRMRVSVLDSRRSQSKPDRGVVTMRQELINQNGQVVMSLEGKSMHRVRPCA